jgi:hypothetical protein
MTNEEEKQIEHLAEVFAKTLSLQASLAEKTADSIMQWHVWESMLCLHFARFYISREDPLASALADRDILMRGYTSVQIEEGARRVEETYQSIIAIIEDILSSAKK